MTLGLVIQRPNPLLYKEGGGGEGEFSNFLKKRGSDFSHKKGRVGKIGEAVVLKKGYHYFHTN